MITKTMEYSELKEKTNLEFKRYKTIINYFEENKERISIKKNQTHLTRLYAELLNKNKLNPSIGFGDLAYKLQTLVGGPNYLLRHWGERNILENLN